MNIPELTVVTLTHTITHEENVIPTGTPGVIVHHWKTTEGEFYEVEFANPSCVITLSRSDISLLI